MLSHSAEQLDQAIIRIGPYQLGRIPEASSLFEQPLHSRKNLLNLNLMICYHSDCEVLRSNGYLILLCCLLKFSKMQMLNLHIIGIYPGVADSYQLVYVLMSVLG